jgi:hypothetical protein
VYFQLCALFRSQMMFALGGAASASAQLSGNPKGRESNKEEMLCFHGDMLSPC